VQTLRHVCHAQLGGGSSAAAVASFALVEQSAVV
jgi:hypothetical protein